MKNNENELNDLMYELALMHKAALHYAGVKSDSLEKAAFAYLELLDEAKSDDDFKIILETIKMLKTKHPEFFNV